MKKVRLNENVKIYVLKLNRRSTLGKYYLVYEDESCYWLPTINDLKKTEKDLKALIKKFPKGKCLERNATAIVSNGNTLGLAIQFSCEYESIKEFKEAGYELSQWK